MSAKHKPGPWMPACKSHGASCRHPAIMSDDGQVAVATWQGSEAATDATARLPDAITQALQPFSPPNNDGQQQAQQEQPPRLPAAEQLRAAGYLAEAELLEEAHAVIHGLLTTPDYDALQRTSAIRLRRKLAARQLLHRLEGRA